MKLLGDGQYKRADTSQEKLRRMKLGLRDSVLVSLLFLLPVIFVFERFVKPTRTSAVILVSLLVGPTILLAIFAEIKSGRAYNRDAQSPTDDEGPHAR